ncbi:MAG TPA: hypothetical protein VNI77_09920 [Nitrososphaera sp.]|nr:hypothetical protein [Nitrososphaera sp.]
MQSTAAVVNAVYLEQGLVDKYRTYKASVSTIPVYTTLVFLDPFPYCNAAPLLSIGAKDLAASLKLLELKYKYSAYVITAGSVLIFLFMLQ